MALSPCLRRPAVGLVGLVIVLSASAGAAQRLRTLERLPSDAEPLTAAALSGRGRPSFVVLTDARFRRPTTPIRSAEGFDVPIVDASGRVVALGLVPYGADDAVLDEAPWGVATPMTDRSARYLARLAAQGLDVRDAPGLVHLHAQRDPGYYAFEAASAVALALLLGLPLLVVGFAPPAALVLVLAGLRRAVPTEERAARVAGALFLGLAGLGFAALCLGEPGPAPGRLLKDAAVAVAGWVGVYLVVAPGTRLWPRV